MHGLSCPKRIAVPEARPSSPTLSRSLPKDPREVAKNFCAEHLRSTDLEDVARCCDTLTASIAQRRETALDSPNPEEEERMISRGASTSQEGNNSLTRAGAHRLRIPLNVNGAEVALAVHTDTAPGDIAVEFCQRQQFGFVGTALDNCISQVTSPSEIDSKARLF